ncbi:helix-turn-helix domain-containing protein [Geofilum rubicundum]|nr:helix-turn-helix transcriptional regulator [Geofilum rubicundum]
MKKRSWGIRVTDLDKNCGAMKKRKYKTLSELEDKYIGEQGTPEREQYEFELSMEILGEKLKKIRKDKNLTQEQLGKLIGVQKAQISKLESGASSATISTITKVFKALKAKVKFQIDIEEGTELAVH